MNSLKVKLAIALCASTIIAGSGAGVAMAGNGNGEGHTPVTLCHWVPAHGGSYIIITVDDDGSSGNKNSRGHAGHENDIIPFDESCPVGGEDGGGEED